MKKIYNIIDSVKGGCGKTTFSLILSLLLDDHYKENRNNDESNVCLIDMDIQGSALAYLLFGGNYFQDEKKWNTFKFLNDRIVAVGDSREETEEYMHRFRFGDKTEDGKKAEKEKKIEDCKGPGIDVIFSDPRPKIKKKYRSLSNQNYSPEVLYSTYRMGLANMLSKLDEEKPYLHQYVNFDMPPNSDAYSDSVYDVLLKKEYTIMKDGDVCNLFLLQTVDKGQIKATLDYFDELVSSENFQKINKIFFVFNDWLDFEEGKDFFNEAVSTVKDNLKNCQLFKKIRDNIYFIGLNFNKEYYRLCTQNDGIRNLEMPKNMLYPIKYITNIEGDEIKIPAIRHAEKETAKNEGMSPEGDARSQKTEAESTEVKSGAKPQEKTEEEKKRMRLADQLIYLLKAGDSEDNKGEKNE